MDADKRAAKSNLMAEGASAPLAEESYSKERGRAFEKWLTHEQVSGAVDRRCLRRAFNAGWEARTHSIMLSLFAAVLGLIINLVINWVLAIDLPLAFYFYMFFVYLGIGVFVQKVPRRRVGFRL
ncbi:hypothetical protein [Mucisphaera sp.]|uniref:hypothetical protein n=1 Tax=Mucisphaera sp. TaxID=2913024 RepID=UPI003D1140E2